MERNLLGHTDSVLYGGHMMSKHHALTITALTLSTALLGACSANPDTVAETVESIIDDTGTTQVARIVATIAKDGPRAELVAVNNGSYTEYLRRPADSKAVDMGDPNFSFIEGSFDVNSIDLEGLELTMTSSWSSSRT